MSRLNQAVLENLIRHAMAAGTAVWAERMSKGEVDMDAPLTDAFGDFPTQFLNIRPGLLEGLIEP